MEKEYEILYHERFDMWILRTGGREEEGRYWNEGTVLFIGGFLPLQDQIDSLLDLILLNDPKQKYFEDILRRLTA